jgi:subtilisin family serine protease
MVSLAILLAATGSAGSVSAATERQPTKDRGRTHPPGGPSAPGGAGEGTTAAVASAWLVELSSLPVAEANPVDESAYVADLQAEKRAFRTAARSAGIAFRERRAFDVLWNGLSIEVSPRDLLALSRIQGVAGLYPVTAVAGPEPLFPLEPGEAEPELYTAITMTGADQAQASGWTGRGVRVAIMDSGVDYNHPDLGGGFGPGFRVEGGFDFVGDDYEGGDEKIEPDPDPMDCGGHGTHVAGILAGNGRIRGVAPEASIRAYKVFGCTGPTSTDIMIEAMERVLADGNQVLNMSIGAAYQWPQIPMARAATNLVNRGVVVVASAGNAGGTGLYSISAPSVGSKVIAAASVDNARVHSPAFDFGGTLYGYLTMAFAAAPPTAGSEEIASGGRACNADLPLPSGVSGRVALIERGACTFREKAINAMNAGATAALIFNSASGIFLGTLGEPEIGFPVASLSREDGLVIRAALPGSLTWTDRFADAVNATGGLISSFSSMGVGPDLSLKPDVSAPGGLIFSTLPLALGGYGLNSGTSMSAPHTAGAAALVLQAAPHTPSQAMRDILQNSGRPGLWAGNPALGFLDSAHRQGAGLIDVGAAIAATTRVLPGRLALGETEGLPVTRTLLVENSGASDATYDLSHRPALSTGANTYSVGFFDRSAGVTFSAPSLLVPAGGAAAVDVTFTEPPTLANRGLFNGYIVITSQGGGRAISVPYAGLKGDYQSLRVLNPAASMHGNPLLRPDDEVGASGPVSIRPADKELAFILVHLDHAVRRLRLELLDAATGLPLGRMGEFGYVGRNSIPSEFYVIAWDGEAPSGEPAPAGSYTIRLSVQKALGDDDNPAHWETWDSPAVTIVE